MLTKKGISGDNFSMNETYGMARFGQGNQYDGVIRFVQSGNVPTLFVDVASGNMEYIHRKKGNEESGTMRLYTVNGDLSVSGSIESIKGRGNATWGCPKKAYSLTLTDAADLLGMGQAQRWILLSNGYDASNLRNKVSYDLANAAGMAYSPDSRWVDLYLNGDYAGLYLLCERNEVHAERVDIAQDNSFLVSRELESRLIRQNYPYVDLKLGSFRIHHLSLDQTKLEDMWRSVESALLAEDGIDPQTGRHWQELIDLDSWVQKYLIDEIASNYDGGFISQYFYYNGADSSGKIYAGPVWDMDSTYGADFWFIAPPNNFVAKRPTYLEDNYVDAERYSPFYMLYQKEEFYRRMVEIYYNHFRPAVLELVDSGLAQYAAEISKAVVADEMRWHTGAPEDRTEKATESIRKFLSERIAFLDAVWIYEEDFCDILLFEENAVSENHVAAWFAVRPGEYLPEIPTEDRVWYVYGTDEVFDVTQPVYESVKLYYKESSIPQESDSGKTETEVIYAGVLLASLIAIAVIDKIRTKKQENRCKQYI